MKRKLLIPVLFFGFLFIALQAVCGIDERAAYDQERFLTSESNTTPTIDHRDEGASSLATCESVIQVLAVVPSASAQTYSSAGEGHVTCVLGSESNPRAPPLFLLS